MTVSGPILVFLANGVQGRTTVEAALRRGHRVRALVRAAPDAGGLGSAEIAEGDLDHPASLVEAAEGAAHFVLQVPTAPQEIMTRQVGHALEAARRAGIRSLVLKLASARRAAPCAEPSFVANEAIARMVREAGIPASIVIPTLYLDNLLKPSALANILTHGVFAPPLAASRKIAWTSAEDCALAAVMLLETGQHGGEYRIAGPEAVDGETLARLLSGELRREVAYRAQDVEAFEAELAIVMGAAAARGVASKFRYLASHPTEAEAILSAPFASLPALPDFRPQSIADWLRHHRARFRSAD